MEIKTIPNRKPNIWTNVTLTTPIVAICPHSGEPQPGSTISVTYHPGQNLIELHAIEEWLAELARGSDPLDLETVAQMLAEDCEAVVGRVVIKAVYRLRNGLEVICECQS